MASSIIDPDEKPAQEVDIEQEIKQEVTGMNRERKDALFQPVRIDIQCGRPPNS